MNCLRCGKEMAKKINIEYAKGASDQGTVVEIHDTLLASMTEELIEYFEEKINDLDGEAGYIPEAEIDEMEKSLRKKRDDYIMLLSVLNLPCRSIIITGRN